MLLLLKAEEGCSKAGAEQFTITDDKRKCELANCGKDRYPQ
jgi:hypothetical protein